MDYFVADTFFDAAMPDSGQLISPYGDRKYLNSPEGIRFCAAAELMPTFSDTIYCLAYFYSGCRMTEVLLWTPRQIDHMAGGIISLTLKQKKVVYRFIPIDRSFLRRLKKLIKIENIQPHERIWKFSRFTGLRRIKACMETAGICGKWANSRGLRHTFAVACATNGVPLNKIQKLLGHAVLKTTTIYTDFIGEDERRLISRIWPSRPRVLITLAFMWLARYLNQIATK